jgi:hypothetical protein
MLDDLVHGWAEMQGALPDYQEAEDYFEGRVAEVFANAKLEAMIAETGERYKFGLAAVPVEALADRVELSSVTASTQPGNDLIAVVTRANDLKVRWPDLVLMSLEYGDAYLQVWDVPEPGPQDGPVRLSDRDLAAAGVEVTVKNPKHCRVFYDDETERRKTYAITRWQVRGPLGLVWRADVYYPDVVERWVSKPGTKPEKPDGWEKYLDADQDEGDWAIPTPTGDEIPVFHFRTAMPYGRPVHARVYGCQDAITKMLVTQLTTTDSHGWPQRYSLAEAGADLDDNNSDPDWGDDADSADDGSVQGGTSSGMRSGPGTIQRFTGTRSVGQFQAASPDVFLDPTSLYIRLMAQLSHTPLHYFDPTGGAPSGESLRVAEAPLVKRATRMQTILTGPIQECWDYILRLGDVNEVTPVVVAWDPAQSATGAAEWETVRVKQDSGVPIPVTLVEMGYDAQTVEKWRLPDHPEDPAAGLFDDEVVDGG